MDAFLDAAAAFATERHEGQTRRDGATPYITHPLRVAKRLQDAGVTKAEIIAAALLHDVLEDTPTRPDELLARFGPRVCALVNEVSRPPGMTRRDFIDRVATGSARSVLVRVADRLDNLQDASALERGFRPVYADEALALAAAALANPRLDRLFPAERRALHTLLAELVATARGELGRTNSGRTRTMDIVRAFPPGLR